MLFTNKPRFDGEFGYFVRVLEDMDLRRKKTKYRVLLEREDFGIFVDLNYDNLPDFLNYCNCICHD